MKIFLLLFIELQLNLPLVNKQTSKESLQEPIENHFDNKFMQLHAEQEEVERQEACLEAWNSLQNDLQQLKDLFIDFNKVVYVIYVILFMSMNLIFIFKFQIFILLNYCRNKGKL